MGPHLRTRPDRYRGSVPTRTSPHGCEVQAVGTGIFGSAAPAGDRRTWVRPPSSRDWFGPARSRFAGPVFVSRLQMLGTTKRPWKSTANLPWSNDGIADFVDLSSMPTLSI